MFNIDYEKEYIQEEPRFSYYNTVYDMDEESIKFLIKNHGRHGMWIGVTIKEDSIDKFDNNKFIWINVNKFLNDTLYGYSVDRDENNVKKRIDRAISIKDIRNIETYDPKLDTQDVVEKITILPFYICDESSKGLSYGKGYISLSEDTNIYYEIYSCGVLIDLYIKKYEDIEPNIIDMPQIKKYEDMEPNIKLDTLIKNDIKPMKTNNNIIKIEDNYTKKHSNYNLVKRQFITTSQNRLDHIEKITYNVDKVVAIYMYKSDNHKKYRLQIYQSDSLDNYRMNTIVYNMKLPW